MLYMWRTDLSSVYDFLFENMPNEDDLKLDSTKCVDLNPRFFLSHNVQHFQVNAIFAV